MSSFGSRVLSRRRLAWGVPILTAAAIGGAVLVPISTSASPHPRLPARTAGQLLAAVQRGITTPLSGTVVETARFGLPALPSADSSASLNWQSLIAGSHSAQVWSAGPDQQRIGLIGTLSEAEVIHSGRDVWTYTSRTNEVTHQTLPPAAGGSTAPAPDPTGRYTPQGAADEALRAIDPSTRVTVDQTQVVSGQRAYTVSLTPRGQGSTIRRVTIAVDSVHSVPLRVQIFGRAARPAFEVGFTDITFATPRASLFQFHVPAGAKVTSDPLGVNGREHTAPGQRDRVPSTTGAGAASNRKVIGSGWTSILELPKGSAGATASGLLDRMTSVQSDGSRLLTTALVNALLTQDGRVFVGAVTPALLNQAAATHR